MLSKIIRPELDFRGVNNRIKGRLFAISGNENTLEISRTHMFHAGDTSESSSDEDEVTPAKVGQADGRTVDSEMYPHQNNHFKRAIPARPTATTSNAPQGNHTNAMPTNPVFHRTTSSIARISMAIRRSLRLPRRSEPRMNVLERKEPAAEVDLNNVFQPAEAPLFTENTRDTRILPTVVPNRLQEVLEYKRQNHIEKVKKIIRRTDWPVCHEIRSRLWKELCTTHLWESSRNVYEQELAEYNRINNGKSQSPQVLIDDGAVMNNFDLKEIGTVKLIRLLLIIERLRPDLVYAPLIYPMCALLLHFNDDDSDVFACITHLLTTKGFMMTTPVQWAASSHTILALVKKHKSSAYTLMKRRLGTVDDAVIVKCFEDWLLWLFQYLPLEHTCRIVDCYLVEGHKFLIRSAISIVYIWSKIQKTTKVSLSGKSLEEKIDAIKQELQNVAETMSISTSTFIATAVKIRNLKSAMISKLQTQYEDELRDQASVRARPLKKPRKTIFCEAFRSLLVDNESAIELMSFMPPRLQLITPTLVFQLGKDGASFTNFWSKCDKLEQSILIIKTTLGEIFGAYLSSAWAERHDRKERTRSKYWGTGESYVFKMNKECDLPEIYQWVGNEPDASGSAPQYFMTAKDQMLTIGSGGGDAIRISEELTNGMTSTSTTFNNPPLCKSGVFDIYELEVFHVPSSD